MTRVDARWLDAKDKDIAALVKGWIFERSHQLEDLRVLTITPQTEGTMRVSLEYAYVAEPRAGLDTSPTVPVVVKGEDVLILRGKRLYILTLNADQAIFSQTLLDWRALLASLRFE